MILAFYASNSDPAAGRSAALGTSSTTGQDEGSEAIGKDNNGRETIKLEGIKGTTIRGDNDIEHNQHFDREEWMCDFQEDYIEPCPTSLDARIATEGIRRSPKPEDFRLLEPGESLLSESESSEEEPESYTSWCVRTNWSSEAANLSIEQKQFLMDVDKKLNAGTGRSGPRPKSVLEKKWIGDYVERARRKEWAKEMGRKFPGRYVPYPGLKRVSKGTDVESAAEKGRRKQREK